MFLTNCSFCTGLFQAIFSQSTPSPTKNPECPEMHAAASHLEKAMTIITKGKADCRVNMHCSGTVFLIGWIILSSVE